MVPKHDPLHLWGDHEACWKMQHRGALGESLLHILVICNTLVHTRIARILLRYFPRYFHAWFFVQLWVGRMKGWQEPPG